MTLNLVEEFLGEPLSTLTVGLASLSDAVISVQNYRIFRTRLPIFRIRVQPRNIVQPVLYCTGKYLN